jgi:hypothetical protein
VIGAGSVFLRGLNTLADLTVRRAVPAVFQDRIFPAADGLMSYGRGLLPRAPPNRRSNCRDYGGPRNLPRPDESFCKDHLQPPAILHRP